MFVITGKRSGHEIFANFNLLILMFLDVLCKVHVFVKK